MALPPNGPMQALTMGHALALVLQARFGSKCVYASPFLRTVETAQAALISLKHADPDSRSLAQIEWGLCEMLGDTMFPRGLGFLQNREQHHARGCTLVDLEYATFVQPTFPEDYAAGDTHRRCASFLEALLEQHRGDEDAGDLLVVTHDGIVDALTRLLARRGLDPLPYCSITQVRIL
jgi:broad specificity phosphatase PhoE